MTGSERAGQHVGAQGPKSPFGTGVRVRRSVRILSLALGAGLRAWLLARTRRFRSQKAQALAESRLWAREGRLLCRTADDMGGLVIKVGQFLATRVDILPVAFTSELGHLLDVVRPEPWVDIEAALVQAYGPGLPPLRSVDPKPVAAASLAQVHRAVLRSGEEVVLKVFRPGIERRVATDLATVRWVIDFTARHTAFGRRYDLAAIGREFAEVTQAELDTGGEARRAERFRAMFADDPRVGVPRVYEELTRPGVLVLEEIHGVRPDDRAALAERGVDPHKVAAVLLESFMRQWLAEGLFHADPHPGNLFVTDAGVLVYVDFGMMAEIRPEDRAALRETVVGILMRSPERTAEGVDHLGFLRPGADRQGLARALGFLLEHMLGPESATMQAHGTDEADAFVAEIRDFLYTHPFQLPARYTFLGRALGILAGVVASLTPDEPFAPALAHAAERELARAASGGRATGPGGRPGGLERLRTGLAALGLDLGALTDDLLKAVSGDEAALARVRDRLLPTLTTLVWLPQGAIRVMRRLDQSGPLVDLAPLLELERENRRALRRLPRVILAAGLIVAGALLHGGDFLTRDILWGLGALLGLFSLGR